ncbi:MAG TPA: DUF4412 domain-containing protein [Acidobacteriota bacterium]|nr:DUF4412 domain-containing protein [Acidobacteriota bacterium]
MKKLALAAIALTVLTANAWAGVVVEMTVTDLTNNQSRPAKIYAQDGLLRMDTEEPGEGSITVLFLGDSTAFILHEEQSYIEMDEETVARLSSQIDQAMKQMEEQLKNMPPAQREMMEKMMKDRMPNMMGEAMEPPVIEKGGTSQTAGYSCTMYEIYRKDEKVRELCAASRSELQAGEELVESFQAMAKFMQKMMEAMPQMSEMMEGTFAEFASIDGFPVMSRQFDDGQAVEETLLDSIQPMSLGPNIFKIPSGYKKQSVGN